MWYMHWIINALVGMAVARGGLYICNIWQLGRERRSTSFYLFSISVGLSFGICCSFLEPHTDLAILTIFFGFVLFMGATIDWQYLILPDEGAIFLLISGIVRLWLIGESIMNAVTSIFIVFFLGWCMYRLCHHSIGLGDVKWLAVSIAWIPWELLWLVLYIAFVSGSLYVVIRLIYERIKTPEHRQCIKGKRLPFGPFLCSSIFIVYIWGDAISAWYYNCFW